MDKKLYKARLHIIHYNKRGVRNVVETQEIVVYGTEEQARVQYNSLKGRFNMYKSLADYVGFVELFEPFIHRDGTLAYYPSGNEYIEHQEIG